MTSHMKLLNVNRDERKLLPHNSHFTGGPIACVFPKKVK